MKAMIYKLGLMSLVLVSVPTTTKADAQAAVSVPFGFNIGNVNYPAGTYFIERFPLQRFVSLENKEGGRIESWSLGPGDPAPTDTRVALIFDAVGSKHILRAVRYGSLITSRLDGHTRSNQEEELRSYAGS